MNMEEMLAQAQKAAETIQKQMGDAQAKLDEIEVEGTAGGGLVKVRATARGRILGVSIDESMMKPEEKQMVEDLVTAAFNDARDRADRVSAEEMEKIQQGAGIPAGFKLPGMEGDLIVFRRLPDDSAYEASGTMIGQAPAHLKFADNGSGQACRGCARRAGLRSRLLSNTRQPCLSRMSGLSQRSQLVRKLTPSSHTRRRLTR